ncbi:MAG: type II toxin-antitoxin system YoeB family toxin [Microlunatus sp.]
MSRKLVFDASGWEDYVYWQTQDRKTLKRINQLIAATPPAADRRRGCRGGRL